MGILSAFVYKYDFFITTLILLAILRPVISKQTDVKCKKKSIITRRVLIQREIVCVSEGKYLLTES